MVGLEYIAELFLFDAILELFFELISEPLESELAPPLFGEHLLFFVWTHRIIFRNEFYAECVRCIPLIIHIYEKVFHFLAFFREVDREPLDKIALYHQHICEVVVV